MSLEIVRQTKAALEAAGEDLSGPCGAWKITQRVAWALRDSGAGLHHKPGGNNCQGYSVDVVIWPDGHYFDDLIDAGGANVPSWQPHQGDAQFWRPPVDPGDVPAPPDPPDPPPDPPDPPVPPDLEPILTRLDLLEEINQALIERLTRLEDRQLPPYQGSGRVGWFGGSFTVISHPKPER